MSAEKKPGRGGHLAGLTNQADKSTVAPSMLARKAAGLDAIVDTLADIVAERVAERLAEQRAPTPTPPLDRAGLARALVISVPSVDRLRSRGCPHFWLLDSPRFELQKVLDWLREQRGPASEKGGR